MDLGCRSRTHTRTLVRPAGVRSQSVAHPCAKAWPRPLPLPATHSPVCPLPPRPMRRHAPPRPKPATSPQPHTGTRTRAHATPQPTFSRPRPPYLQNAGVQRRRAPAGETPPCCAQRRAALLQLGDARPPPPGARAPHLWALYQASGGGPWLPGRAPMCLLLLPHQPTAYGASPPSLAPPPRQRRRNQPGRAPHTCVCTGCCCVRFLRRAELMSQLVAACVHARVHAWMQLYTNE